MAGIKRKKCCNCKELFIPDPRNIKRQKYCSKPQCRKASKAASQRRWLAKPENQDYFSGAQNVKRVQLWREANPGYWRRKRKTNKDALQDRLISQPIENNTDNVGFENGALQDFLITQPPVLLGLIANFTGNALQDNMVITLQRLQKLGQDIVTNLTQGPQALQLDRSPPGPGSTH
jgi:hypothetical protein